MNKEKFFCKNCGNVEAKWSGMCGACGEWNTMTEGNFDTKSHKNLKVVSINQIESKKVERLRSTLDSLDHILGGGFVLGGVILLAGEPGIGKSTLLLQLACTMQNVLYISAEESLDQIGIRAKRIAKKDSNARFFITANLQEILAVIEREKQIDLIIIDSIQMVGDSNIGGIGSINQMRNAANEIIQVVKNLNIATVIVSHITKDGQIAGPKIVEHMVDAVLYFEGENSYQYRVLRTIKNRFGPTNEMAIFSMKNDGLDEVQNPALMFLESRSIDVSGSVIFPMFNNGKVIFLEIQALVAPAHNLQNPQRSVVGLDLNRMIMLLAVLHSRYKLSFAGKDIYLNVVGGMRVNETAVDLAVIVTLISAHKDLKLSKELCIFGEVGLSGEVRQVANFEKRITEAQRFSFAQTISANVKNFHIPNFNITEINTIADLKKIFE